jgi:cell division protein ZapA (FtsZ GTPase activity inhibitor)
LEQLVTIELFGQPYTFKTQSEFPWAKEVADYLVEEVGRVEGVQSGTMTNANKITVMISAALNIAKECLETKRDHQALVDELTKRSAGWISRLDRCATQAENHPDDKLPTGV